MINGGDYPVPDNDSSFDILWREELSHIPEAPLTWKEREPFRIFAEKVFRHIAVSNWAQKLANEAYNDGFNDGKDEIKESIQRTIESYDVKILDSRSNEDTQQIMEDRDADIEEL